MKTFEPALKNITIYVKYAVLLLGQLWWKIGLLLILSSGHTAFECKTATTTAIGTLKNVFAKNATYERTNGWNVSPMDDCLLQYFPFYKVTYWISILGCMCKTWFCLSLCNHDTIPTQLHVKTCDAHVWTSGTNFINTCKNKRQIYNQDIWNHVNCISAKTICWKQR